jgi:phycocyanin-associated rod protein
MKVSAGTRGTGLNSSRQVALTVTGVSNNDYSRTADMVMNVPFTRMNETMRLVHSLGGRIISVSVTGGGIAGSPEQPAPRKEKAKAREEG